MLKKLVKEIISYRGHPLARNSFFMMGSALLVNFLAYVFNVFMVRLLGPSSYGVFASLVSVLTIVSVPATALTTATTKFTAGFRGEKNAAKVASLFLILLKILTVIGLAMSILFISFSRQIAGYLNLNEVLPVIIIGLSFLIILPQTAALGVLQGLQSFLFISLNSVFSAAVKLIGGIGFVLLGLGVSGALLGFILAILVPFTTSLFVLRSLFAEKQSALDWRSFLRYMPLAAVAILGLTSLTTSDIILVKHYFSSTEAGIYSSLSLVGRVILYASFPISTVMFPIVAEKHASKDRYHQYLFYSLAMVGTVSFLITVLYFLFPKFFINFFFGSAFLAAAPYLGFFGVFITLYSITNVLVTFFLSVHRTGAAVFLIFAAGLQWLLISFFHRNFWQVISVSVSVLTLLTLTLLLYLLREYAFRYRSRL